ncbi:MAG: ATP-dependent helicase [Ignavibacteria bacterium]|nr:ATP-dependent helicase [Ignavibacteria bacterium]
MPITPQQIQAAKQIQDAAAQDTNQTVRLVAGPGTGKSFVIEGRIQWLLANLNVPPQNIIAISFTRAASKDLKDRIYDYCIKHNQPNVTNVRVSTLHSLALYILRRTGNLNLFPTNPIILDDWELTAIFDSEYGRNNKVNPSRCEEIRRDHEAFWSTGNWNPPNLPVLKQPITAPERTSFNAFYYQRTQAYSCVLPGEIIRMCVSQIQAGLIDPVTVLGVQHLIVDEVQDLNQCDFDFIDLLIQRGVNVFISGDDDQSVYSFRHAFPQGIQSFITNYPNSTNHVLSDCFRCTPSVLNAAVGIINTFPSSNRIPKNLVSLYSNSNPINPGFLQANIFRSPKQEATFIANSCQAFINMGISPKDIMILISNKRVQLKPITDALDNLNIGYDANQREDFKDSNLGRFLLSVFRILENINDYISHRVLLGTPNKIGLATCCSITDKVITNNINYTTVFYNTLPNGIFTKREVTAINKVKSTLQIIQNWSLNETINQRVNDIDQILLPSFSQTEVNGWRAFISSMPLDMSLNELKDYLQTDSQETKDNIINSILIRLNQTTTQSNPLPEKVRIISLHSSKGLSAKVVFIPGLEETIFPNSYAQQIPGLVLECARLFYVAMTRAKAACIISYTQWRNLYGNLALMTPSRFCSSTGAVFRQQNNNVLTTTELHTIHMSITNL